MLHAQWHAGFKFGFRSKYTFIQRTIAGIGELMSPLEQRISGQLIPALFQERGAFGDLMRSLFGLPSRAGGIDMDEPVLGADGRYNDSYVATAVLRDLLVRSEARLPDDYDERVSASFGAARSQRLARLSEKVNSVKLTLDDELAKAVDLACVKGASSVYSVLPLEEYGFAIKGKRDYADLLRMRYRLPLRDLPSTCVCGKAYSLDHSQICMTGGFIHMRHDEPKLLWADLCRSAGFNDVEVEPLLVPLSGEELSGRCAKVEDGCRSDVRVRSFWRGQQEAFFEFRVFYPFASSYVRQSSSALFRQHANERKREYSERINRVDSGSFTPMIFASTGGMGPQMEIALKHLASRISEREGQAYSRVMALLRCRFGFAMARSSLVCLRGTRSRWKSRSVCFPGAYAIIGRDSRMDRAEQ